MRASLIHKTIFEMGVIACSDRLCTTFICMMQVVLLWECIRILLPKSNLFLPERTYWSIYIYIIYFCTCVQIPNIGKKRSQSKRKYSILSCPDYNTLCTRWYNSFGFTWLCPTMFALELCDLLTALLVSLGCDMSQFSRKKHWVGNASQVAPLMENK